MHIHLNIGITDYYVRKVVYKELVKGQHFAHHGRRFYQTPSASNETHILGSKPVSTSPPCASGGG